MGIKLRIIPAEGAFEKAEVGDMWRTPKNDHDGRECWHIRLPDKGVNPNWGNYWYTTAGTQDSNGWNAWEVTGEPPNITVSPSINILGENGWHGHIKEGEIV